MKRQIKFYEITEKSSNKDIAPGMDKWQAQHYYSKLYNNFKSTLPKPSFYPAPERDDIYVLDFAKGPCGLKAYGAEKIIANLKKDVVAYAAPRVGHAAEAIAYLCEKYNKKAVFFAAASNQVTPHQAVVTAYKGCELRFCRIAAMPNLNLFIKQWCNKFGHQFLPFGLSGVEDVTSSIVKLCIDHTFEHGEPEEFWCAVSTGTMIRALEIGWPNAKGKGVAVARNIKDGEKGEAEVQSYHRQFYQSSSYTPKIETTATYDAKAYEYFIAHAQPGAVFINVGSDKQIQDRLVDIPGWEKINSKRDWKDKIDFSYDFLQKE